MAGEQRYHVERKIAVVPRTHLVGVRLDNEPEQFLHVEIGVGKHLSQFLQQNRMGRLQLPRIVGRIVGVEAIGIEHVVRLHQTHAHQLPPEAIREIGGKHWILPQNATQGPAPIRVLRHRAGVAVLRTQALGCANRLPRRAISSGRIQIVSPAGLLRHVHAVVVKIADGQVWHARVVHMREIRRHLPGVHARLPRAPSVDVVQVDASVVAQQAIVLRHSQKEGRCLDQTLIEGVLRRAHAGAGRHGKIRHPGIKVISIRRQQLVRHFAKRPVPLDEILHVVVVDVSSVLTPVEQAGERAVLKQVAPPHGPLVDIGG